MTFSLPLPPLGCSPNSTHCHWSLKSKARKEYRQTAFGIAYQNKPANWDKNQKFRVDLEWFMGKDAIEIATGELRLYRPLDSDNAIASMKSAMDGLKDAGILFNDSHKWLERGECILHRTAESHKGMSCVIVRIEPV